MQLFNGDYKFRGKHALYVKFLTTERGQLSEDKAIIFERIVDAYMISALVGLRQNRRSKIDDSINESSTINYGTLQSESNKINYIYRVIMLCDKSQGLSEKERIDRAFKRDTDKKAIEENMRLFNSYVLGGLEFIYEMFKNFRDQNEKDVEDKMMNIIQLLQYMSDVPLDFD